MLNPFNRRTTVPYADPLRAGRHPFQTFLLILSAISGIPLLFGVKTAGSVEALLPPLAGLFWGAALSLGSIVGLVGSYWPRGHYATALTMERIGLLLVGPAALLYASLVGIYLGQKGIVTMLILVAFGVSAIVRAHDIGLIILRAGDMHRAETVLREGESEPEGLLRRDEEE